MAAEVNVSKEGAACRKRHHMDPQRLQKEAACPLGVRTLTSRTVSSERVLWTPLKLWGGSQQQQESMQGGV